MRLEVQVLLRRPRRGTFLVAAVALAGLAPATAGAGTAAVFGRTLAYQASPGEANRVTVTRTPDAYRILDRGANVVAGAGCTSLAPNEVACAGDEVRMIRVQVLDGNDVVSLSVGRKSIVGGGDGDDVLEGGEGDDELYGDAGDDTLKGGAGFDVLTGATGADTMSGGGPSIGIDPEELGEDEFFVDIALYEGRTNGVTVDLDDVADDGEAGERDNVMRDVEVVAGGRGADTLVGNELANGFFSGPGRDMIVSGGGFDFIFGGVDADVLNAGAGRLDYLRGERGDDDPFGPLLEHGVPQLADAAAEAASSA